MRQVNLGNGINFKMAERFINGGVYTGDWVVFNYPQSLEMLTFLATHIINIKKNIAEANLEKTKNVNNSSSAFFMSLNSNQKCNI